MATKTKIAPTKKTFASQTVVGATDGPYDDMLIGLDYNIHDVACNGICRIDGKKVYTEDIENPEKSGEVAFLIGARTRWENRKVDFAYFKGSHKYHIISHGEKIQIKDQKYGIEELTVLDKLMLDAAVEKWIHKQA